MFSKRTNWPKVPNPLVARLEAFKKDGLDIIDLTESNPSHCGFKYPSSKIIAALSDQKNMAYAPSPQGMKEARDTISLYYKDRGCVVDPKKIFLTCSTSESYSIIFKLLVNADERILIPTPSYPLFELLASLNDVQIDFYQLIYNRNEGWHIDLEALEAAVRPDTRLIMLVNPNNPTGSFISERELSRINSICKRHGLSIVCDEVFLDYLFEEDINRAFSLVNNNSGLTFTLGGISKCLGLPQMKLAWITVDGPEDKVDEALRRLEIICDTYLSTNTPSQNALPKWMSFGEEIRGDIIRRIKTNRDFILKALKDNRTCEFLCSQGGWYGILRLPGGRSEEDWAIEFLEKDNVFVHPGYFFDFDDGAFIVISLLVPTDIFQNGFGRILNRMCMEIS